MDWLRKEPRGRYLAGTIVVCLFVQFAYTGSIFTLGTFIGFGFSGCTYIDTGIPILTPTFPIVLFVTALIEEVFFRLPLAIDIHRGVSLKRTVVHAIILSAVFGMLHPHTYHFHNFAFQGTYGILWSGLFLKCGGMNKNYAKALLSTTTAHFLFNGIVVLTLLFEFGEKTF